MREYIQLHVCFLFHRVVLTADSTDFTLHVLCYNDHAHFLSAEVALWFWESDVLQSELRRAQRSVWGRILQEHQARALFQELRSTKETCRFLRRGQRSITVYDLEEWVTVFCMYILYFSWSHTAFQSVSNSTVNVCTMYRIVKVCSIYVHHMYWYNQTMQRWILLTGSSVCSTLYMYM